MSPAGQLARRFGNDPGRFAELVRKVISIDLEPYDWSEDVKEIEAPIFMAIGDADGVRYELRSRHPRHLRVS